MHHRNTERLVWIYDVHLIAGRLSPPDWGGFSSLAQDKGLRGGLLARARTGAPVPRHRGPASRAVVARAHGSTRAHRRLSRARTWVAYGTQREPHGAPIVALADGAFAEIAFPRAAYVFASYGIATTPGRWFLLPCCTRTARYEGVGAGERKKVRKSPYLLSGTRAAEGTWRENDA